MKSKGESAVLLTAYDYPTAFLVDEAGIEVVLVGDSLAMVVLGYETTLPVTLEEMLSHTKAVTRAVKRAFVVTDMPFMSFQVSPEEAVRNAGRFMAEGGADGVKLEGGRRVTDAVRRIVKAGIPVMGHIGLTPQSASQLGGYCVQGKTAEEALGLIEEAKVLEDSGVFSIILESVPEEVAKEIRDRASIPIYGIGAGRYCDGQILVVNDILGLFQKFLPRFAKRYADLCPIISEALDNYLREVKEGEFPSDEHISHMKEEELEKLREKLRAIPDHGENGLSRFLGDSETVEPLEAEDRYG